MQQQIKKVVTFCDVCSKETPYGSKCKICGKDVCYECAKDNTKTFNHAVNFQGSGDGTYCNECLGKPIPPEHIDLLEAYKMIASLRAECVVWNKNFDARCKAAEAKVNELLIN